MALVDALLTAMVRADGDALVMHVGEKPIVIAGSRTIDLSNHGLNLSAMVGMLRQLLPADAQSALREDGAVEHLLPPLGDHRFSVVAARGGDDIWIEIRRRRDSVESEPAESDDSTLPADAELAAAKPEVGARTPIDRPDDGGLLPVEVMPFLVEGPTDSSPPPALAGDTPSPSSEGADTTHALEEPRAAGTEAAAGTPVENDAPLQGVGVGADETEATATRAQARPAEQPHPTPVLASTRVEEPPASELERAMSSNEAKPQYGPPAGGLPPPVPPRTSGASSVAADPSPVTRTVRIEVPSRVNPGRAARADQLLRAAATRDATELFLVSHSRPCIRAGGDVQVLADEAPLQPADVETLLADLTPEPWRDDVRRGEPTEWLIELTGVGRVRCASFRDHRGPGAIFHFVATNVASAEQIGLGPDAVLLATEPEGLVIIAGPARSDRSSIVAAFVDTINQRRSDYIITVEPQLRTLHENRHALISQRDYGADESRAVALAREALREQPDVLVLEDIGTTELAALAVEAAGDGRLVIVSVEASSTSAAVQRIAELLPVDARSTARTAFSRVFRGAIAQLLVRKSSGGRLAAREVLLATREIVRLIGDESTPGLAAALDARPDAGAASMVDVLAGYVRDGSVDVREAFRKAPDPARLLASLRDYGVDTSTVERLA